MHKYIKQFKLTLTTAEATIEEVIYLDELGYGFEDWERLSDGEKEDILDDYLQSWLMDMVKLKVEELPEPKQEPPKPKYEPIKQDYDVYGVVAF